MGYATAIVRLEHQPEQRLISGREFVATEATICGKTPVDLTVRVSTGAKLSQLFAQNQPGDVLLISGDLELDEDGSVPIVDAKVIGKASEDQYLNEAVIIGRVASECRYPKDSDKSVKRSVAVNRYKRVDGEEKPVEHTDWHGVRAYGFTKEKFETVAKGSLVEVTGCIEQLTNAKGENFCEIKARSVKVHRTGRGAPNPAADSTTAGYEAEAFMGSPDDLNASDW